MTEVVTLFSPGVSHVHWGTPIGVGTSLGGNSLVGFGRTLGALLGDTFITDKDSSSDEKDTEDEDLDGYGATKYTPMNRKMTLSSSETVEVEANTEITGDVRKQMRHPDFAVVDMKISSDKMKLCSPKVSPRRSKRTMKLKIMPLKEVCLGSLNHAYTELRKKLFGLFIFVWWP